MGRPKVIINKSNGNLGQLNDSEDGTTIFFLSAVAIVDDLTLGTIAGPFRSLADVEALGITQDWDVTNEVMVWHHFDAFYNVNNNTAGIKTYLMPTAKTDTLAEATDKDGSYASKLYQLKGEVKQAVFGRVPDGAYTPTYTDGLENDIITAITNIKNLVAFENTQQRPLRCILEGRNIQTPYSSLKDNREAAGPNNNACLLVAWQDGNVAAEHASFAEYAAVGYTAGKKAGEPVQRSIARVKSGPVDQTIDARLSDGVSIDTLTETEKDLFHDQGYVILVDHIRKPGYYHISEFTCTPATDDYARYSDGLTVDKAQRIAIDIYTEELEDDIFLNDDGTMSPATLKDFQGTLENAIKAQMAGEISNATVFIDPAQNVASTAEIAAELNIFKKGKSGKITVTIGFKLNTE